MNIEHEKNTKLLENTIQTLAIIIGKLETKAIGMLVEDIELPKILDQYLS